MIRIAHISDSHFDERGRLDDVVAVHDAFLEQARDAEVDLIVHAGDVFERRSTPAERLAFGHWLQDVTRVAPVVIAKGNHDQAGDLQLFNDLLGLRASVYERPTVENAPIWYLRGGEKQVGILALPWFDKAHLVAGLDATVDAEQTRQLTMEAARGLLDSLAMEASRLRALGAVPILVGHVMVAGSETSTGQTLIGTTVELAPSDLIGVGAAYCALGHIHKAQEWFGGRVAYSGSPHRCNYGEPEPKGWRLVTLEDDGTFVSNDFRELPARRMVLLECDWSREESVAKLRIHNVNICFGLGDGGWNNDQSLPAGALVRFRYHIRAEDLHLVDESAIEKILLADGAAEVQIEAVVVSAARARAPEIVHIESVADKVEAYLQAKGIQVDDFTRTRLREKVGLLEGA